MGLVDGKVAIVTGAAAGIGRQSALAFAREGAKVVVSDVADGIEETVKMIKDAGGEAIACRCDVTDAAGVQALVKLAVDTYGRLDCAHNNAGIVGDQGPFTADYAEASFEKVLMVNLKGPWLCMKYELPAMIASGGGAIVNTASIAGVIGFAGSSAYVASKWGVNGITKTAALEYAPSGIRVNSVCPGIIETAMTAPMLADENMRAMLQGGTPMGRVGQPEEMAEVAVWLCSDRASFVTGHNLIADGGYTAQ
jgi:NAD(P)-dependent dehydrogenase (short-subunit alcohol dehydrogenase family)